MGVNNSKASYLWLPAQSGKTRKIIEYINMYRDIQMLIEYENGIKMTKWDEDTLKQLNEKRLYQSFEEKKEEKNIDDNFFNIVICSNNSLLVKQTQDRMEKELYSSSFLIHEENDIEEVKSNSENMDVYAWLSDNKNNRSVNDVAYSIIHDELKMLICCAHSKRLGDYLNKLLDKLDKDFEKKRFNKKINIWIDEADSSVKLWSKFESILTLNIINRVTLVSATFESVIRKYKIISVIPFENTHSDTYIGLRDLNFICCDDSKCDDILDFVKYTIKKNDIQDDIKPGFILFAPGNVKIESHNNIKSYFLKKGCAVAILNGNEKKIYIPNRQSIEIPIVNKEIGQVIKNIYEDYELNQYPFVITGQLCLGRGITLQSENFMFDAAIIPYIKNFSSLYQLGARMNSNLKNSLTKTQIIYCTEKTKKKLLETEKCAINIAKILHTENKTEVDKNFIKKIKRQDIDFEYKVFETQERGISFIKSTLNSNPRRRTDNLAPNVLLENGDNPSLETLINRQWGLSLRNKYRMVPIDTNEWVVYWRPSFFQN